MSLTISPFRPTDPHADFRQTWGTDNVRGVWNATTVRFTHRYAAELAQSGYEAEFRFHPASRLEQPLAAAEFGRGELIAPERIGDAAVVAEFAIGEGSGKRRRREENALKDLQYLLGHIQTRTFGRNSRILTYSTGGTHFGRIALHDDINARRLVRPQNPLATAWYGRLAPGRHYPAAVRAGYWPSSLPQVDHVIAALRNGMDPVMTALHDKFHEEVFQDAPVGVRLAAHAFFESALLTYPEQFDAEGTPLNGRDVIGFEPKFIDIFRELAPDMDGEKFASDVKRFVVSALTRAADLDNLPLGVERLQKFFETAMDELRVTLTLHGTPESSALFAELETIQEKIRALKPTDESCSQLFRWIHSSFF